ncbi:MAG: hypothetical protein ACE5EF_03920 [Dehalococcoidia bacterium]
MVMEKTPMVWLGGAWKDGDTQLSGCGFIFAKADDGKSTLVVKGAGDRIVGRLWQNEGDRGPRFSGSLGRDARIALWPNKRKEKDTHPDYNVSVEQARKKDEPKASDFQDGAGQGSDTIPFNRVDERLA